jgi:uncharacterized membrane protein YqjE
MPDHTTEDFRATEAAGIFGHLTALLSAKLAYLRARLELAGLESREAAVHYGIILALVIGGLLVLVFGYLFLVIALVFLLAHLIGTPTAWIWVTLGAAVLHFLSAAVLFVLAKSRLGAPMFSASLHEFKQDQEWLTTNAKPN